MHSYVRCMSRVAVNSLSNNVPRFTHPPESKSKSHGSDLVTGASDC